MLPTLREHSLPTQAATQIPDVGELTKAGYPWWAVVLIVVSVAVIALCIALPKLVPMLRQDDKPKPAAEAASAAAQPAAVTALVPASSAIAAAAETKDELIARVVARMDDRLDTANAEIGRVRDAANTQIEQLRGQLADSERRGYESRTQLADAERALESCGEDRRRLQWRIDQMQRPGGGQW